MSKAPQIYTYTICGQWLRLQIAEKKFQGSNLPTQPTDGISLIESSSRTGLMVGSCELVSEVKKDAG